MIKLLLTLLLLLILIGIWVILYDSTRFVTTKYKIVNCKIQKQCKALFITDLHNHTYGRDNHLLLKTIEECQPDFILIGGDLLTATPGKKMDVAISLLKELVKHYPIYYANGNHEYRLKLYPQTYGTMAEEYEAALQKIGIKRLENERNLLKEYGIEIFGCEIDKSYYVRFRIPHMEKEYLNSILGEPDHKNYAVLLAHNPDFFSAYAAWGADLVLSGHVHGGVVRVPFLGKGVIAPSLRLFPHYDGGLFEEGNAKMVLSRGMGAHTIPFRMFNPAELVELSFVPTDDM